MRSAFTVANPSVDTFCALNYSPFLESFRQPRGGKKSVRLGEMVSAVGPAYGTVFTRIDCHPSHGVELISQSDMFSAEPAGRVVRLDSMTNPERHLVQKWQVLIAGAGTLGETELYGRPIIADARLEGKYVGPDALALTFKEPGSVDNLYVYAFLCTDIGVSLMRSTSYGTKLLRFWTNAVRKLCIPEAEQAVKKEVAKLIRTAVLNREIYIHEIRAARQVIENLPEVRKALSASDAQRARCTIATGPFVTLGARNHAALGAACEVLANHWKSRIADLLEPNGIYNGPRFARTPCKKPFGIDFLDQRDVFAIRPVARRIVAPRISDRLLYVPSHALIVASHGQMSEGSLFGHVETAAFGLHRCGITQDILRVLPKPEYHDFLLAFLSSRLGFLLLKSTAIGTSIPMMHTGLLAELPHPPMTDDVLAQISTHVQAAIKARAASETAENEAVRIIEEEVLPTWLA